MSASILRLLKADCPLSDKCRHYRLARNSRREYQEIIKRYSTDDEDCRGHGKKAKRQGSSSFLKKRTKKLLFASLPISRISRISRISQQSKSFLFLFFKKEILPSLLVSDCERQPCSPICAPPPLLGRAASATHCHATSVA
jgi:hypothetical protein